MHSLRDKISAIVLAFLILVSTAFVIYSRFTAQNYKNLRLAEIEKIVEFETEKVNETITEIERTAIFLATSGRICFETQSKGLGEDIAIDQLKSFPTIMGAGFWFAPYKYNEKTFREGTYAQFDKKLNEPRLKDTLYDYHSLNWYKELFESTAKPYQAAWTDPYTGNIGSNVLMTTAGAGIFTESGELIGVSTIDWEIESVIDELTAIKPTDNSFVLKTGKIISAETTAFQTSEAPPVITQEYTKDPSTTQYDDEPSQYYDGNGIYNLSFSANGGKGQPATQQVYEGDYASLPTSGVLRDGYTLAGWSQSPDIQYPLYNFTMPAADTVLYAVWEPNSYTVTYDSSGGLGLVSAAKVKFNGGFNAQG